MVKSKVLSPARLELEDKNELQPVPRLDVLVIGGGQAGLASGYHLKKAGLTFLILEASPLPAGSWPSYYDSLKLFSPARYSALPGLGFPGRQDRYPTRDEVVSYLTSYTEHFKLPIRTNTKVITVEVLPATQQARGVEAAYKFKVTTNTEEVYLARSVIVATGSYHYPYLPKLPGQELYQGRVLHASQYRNPLQFKGERVLVVGSRNSAVQLAVELASVARTTLTSRQPVSFKPQTILGKDIHFWLRSSGFDTFPLGYWRNVPAPKGVLDYSHTYEAALRAGKPNWRPLFHSFSREGVIWSNPTLFSLQESKNQDGAEKIDNIIFATGYLPRLDFLAGTGATDGDGQPLHRAGISTSLVGLYYVGLAGQKSFASATLRGVGPDAAYIVSRLKKFDS